MPWIICGALRVTDLSHVYMSSILVSSPYHKSTENCMGYLLSILKSVAPILSPRCSASSDRCRIASVSFRSRARLRSSGKGRCARHRFGTGLLFVPTRWFWSSNHHGMAGRLQVTTPLHMTWASPIIPRAGDDDGRWGRTAADQQSPGRVLTPRPGTKPPMSARRHRQLLVHQVFAFHPVHPTWQQPGQTTMSVSACGHPDGFMPLCVFPILSGPRFPP